MPKGVTDDVSNIIVGALSRGISADQISDVVGISKRSVTRISTNLSRYGTAKPPPSGAKRGRPLKVNDEIEEV